MNPTTDVLEQRVAAIEGGTASCGNRQWHVGNIFSITICKAGDHIAVSASFMQMDTLFRHTLPRLKYIHY